MRRLLLPILILVALVPAAVPAVAAAQSNPFGPLPPGSQATPEPTATPVSNSTQSDVSRPMLLGIAGGVAVIFVGIGIFITRDARSHLTDDDRRSLEGRRADEEQRHSKTQKTKARAAGKRQRQARRAQRRR